MPSAALEGGTAVGNCGDAAARCAPFAGHAGETVQAASFLYDLYGTRATDVLALARSDAGAPAFAELSGNRGPGRLLGARRALRQLSDFLRRRTLLGASGIKVWMLRSRRRADGIRAQMGGARLATEIEEYRREIASTLAFRNNA